MHIFLLLKLVWLEFKDESLNQLNNFGRPEYKLGSDHKKFDVWAGH